MRTDWGLMDYLYGSDHFPILMTIDGVVVGGVPCRPTLSLGRVDWAAFRRSVAHIYGHPGDSVCDDQYSCDALYKNLVECVFAAGGGHRKSARFPRRTSIIWWNVGCTDLINQKRAAFRAFKYEPSIDNLCAYKEICKVVKKRFAAIRRDSFREFCPRLNPSIDSASLWRTIKAFSKVPGQHHPGRDRPSGGGSRLGRRTTGRFQRC